MKVWVVLAIALVLVGAPAWAQPGPVMESCSFLEWDPNPAADLVTKYTVYVDSGIASPAPVDVAAPAVTISCGAAGIAADGPYVVAVTATNATGESGPSDAIAFTLQAGSIPTPPTRPGNFCIRGFVNGQPVKLCGQIPLPE